MIAAECSLGWSLVSPRICSPHQVESCRPGVLEKPIAMGCCLLPDKEGLGFYFSILYRWCSYFQLNDVLQWKQAIPFDSLT